MIFGYEENFLFFENVSLYIRVSLDVRDNVIISKCNKVMQSVEPSMK